MERKAFPVFSSSQEMFYREVLLSPGSPDRSACWFHAMRVWANPGCVIIILPSYVGSLHW